MFILCLAVVWKVRGVGAGGRLIWQGRSWRLLDCQIVHVISYFWITGECGKDLRNTRGGPFW